MLFHFWILVSIQNKLFRTRFVHCFEFVYFCFVNSYLIRCHFSKFKFMTAMGPWLARVAPSESHKSYECVLMLEFEFYGNRSSGLHFFPFFCLIQFQINIYYRWKIYSKAQNLWRISWNEIIPGVLRLVTDRAKLAYSFHLIS